MTLLILAVVILLGWLGYFTFRGILNIIQYLPWSRWWVVTKGWPVFFYFLRDIGENQPLVSMSRVVMIAYPWLRGKGIQFHVRKYVLILGFGRAHQVEDNGTDPLLQQLGGRELDVDPSTIGKEWK